MEAELTTLYGLRHTCCNCAYTREHTHTHTHAHAHAHAHARMQHYNTTAATVTTTGIPHAQAHKRKQTVNPHHPPSPTPIPRRILTGRTQICVCLGYPLLFNIVNLKRGVAKSSRTRRGAVAQSLIFCRTERQSSRSRRGVGAESARSRRGVGAESAT